ncbi:MAG: sugar phosphate nucleotidyltransferase [Planctomycetota bacterium]|nr:sugar phosphate nucleotidyltransferase [Planctomycetota bacterium]MDP6940477.1 sugar phosphate nucleotidyltransferase [Planctomycetota bacterium]
MTSPTSALLLAGGKATRLGALREQWAKACVPVGDTTPLGFLIPRLATAGVERIWVNLHFRPDQVREEAERVAPKNIELRFLREKELLGTGGTLLQVSSLDALPDLVVNAKMFTDYPFEDLLQQEEPGVVLHSGNDLSTFGGLQYHEGRVTGLAPKGTPHSDAAAVFTGICKPSPQWLTSLRKSEREGTLCMVRDGLLPALAEGHSCRAQVHNGWWHEISTPDRVDAARDLLGHP